jgi:transcriptional regulator with AAA-type ATPase domain
MTESDHPVLLIGDRGVGKSSLISDRLKATCGGDISDVFYITINCNAFVFFFRFTKFLFFLFCF